MRTRNERKRDDHDLTVFLLLCAAGLTLLLLRGCAEAAEAEANKPDQTSASVLTYAETQEDPLESEAIEAAVRHHRHRIRGGQLRVQLHGTDEDHIR